MSRAVVIAFEFGSETISAHSRIGALAGTELHWEAPPPAADGTPFWATDECHALILEGLAVMHHAHVDTLVLALPAGEVEAHRERLERACAGRHEVRNTECRSQRFTVHVRHVKVVPQPLEDFLRDAHPAR